MSASRELCAFDSSEALLVVLAADNRLRLWDVGSGTLRQQFDEGKHLGRRYTAMDWHRPRAARKKRSSSGEPKAASLGLVALGTSEGTIVLWDLQRGVVACVMGEGMGLADITAIAFSTGRDDGSATLFSASSLDDSVLEWEVASGSLVRRIRGLRHGATCLCAHPSGNSLAVAGSGVRVLDVTTGKRLRKFAGGHRKAVAALCFSRCGRYLAAAAAESRFVELFDCAGSKAERPFASLTLGDYPVDLQLCATAAAAGGDVLTALVRCESGSLSVLRLRMDGKDGGTAEECNIVGSRSALEVVKAALGTAQLPAEVLVAHGSPSAPVFEAVTVAGSGGVLLGEAAVKVALPTAAKKTDIKARDIAPKAERVAGPGDLGVRGAAVDAASAVAPADMKADREEEEDEEEGATTKRSADRSAPLGERLEALSRAMDEEEARQILQVPRNLPTVESMATVLQQALQSSDDRLLESCLVVVDAQMVDATVDKIPSVLVLPFLERVVAKFEKKPGRAIALAVWIRALLTRHTGYLMSVPNLASQLAKLCQTIDFRLASFPRFLDLAGRLDLVLSHVAPAPRSGRGVRADPQSVYKESDDDGEDSASNGSDAEEEEDTAAIPTKKPAVAAGSKAKRVAAGSDDEEGDESEEV